ncbi:MAG: DUF3828 domain-containing protein [Prevotella sp.]|nr:DUF3828 domain-containing protein [Prevotella sp.]
MDMTARGTVWIGALLFAFWLAGCAPGHQKGERQEEPQGVALADTASAAVEEQKQTAADVERRVKEIYDAMSAAYYGNPGEETPVPSVDLDKDFCSESWNERCRAVVEKDAQNPDEMVFFDADYWVMGQDYDNPHARDIKVVKMDERTAVVELLLHNMSDIPVRLEMVFERGKWYIDNFIDLKHDMDWGKSIDEYLNE